MDQKGQKSRFLKPFETGSFSRNGAPVGYAAGPDLSPLHVQGREDRLHAAVLRHPRLPDRGLLDLVGVQVEAGHQDASSSSSSSSSSVAQPFEEGHVGMVPEV